MTTPVATRVQAPANLPPLPTDIGLTWRALMPGDVPTWFALTQTIETHDDAIERGSEQDLADVFKADWRDPQRDLVGGFDADGRLRAYAWSEYHPATSGTLAPILIGGVHPSHRRRGIGRALLAWLEARGRQQLAATDSTLPARLRVFIDETHTVARSLAEQMGFTQRRWYLDMQRDLAQPLPTVRPADGVIIAPYTAERDAEVLETHNKSFAVDHWGSSPISADAWALDVVGADGFRPDWSFVAVDDTSDRIAGYTLSFGYQQEWAAKGYTEGWTQLIAVRREYRGRGLAAALLTAAMQAFTASGMQYAGLDVDTDNPTGALSLYTKLGYVPGRKAVLYTKEFP